jgi:hypothetical protein
MCCCTADAVAIVAQPFFDAPAISQLAYGETFALIDKAGGWAWGRCGHDDYVGYVPAEALGPLHAPSHWVTVPLCLVFTGPDIKARVAKQLSMGAKIAGVEEGDFLRIDDGFIHLRQVSRLDAVAEDPVEVAERLLGAPYRWGGRGAGGIDCSGLIQRSLELAGIDSPRDSDMQRDQLGEALADDAALRRGDLIFFPGHVGFMVDGTHLIHANAYWMATVIEPLTDVVARLAPTHDQPITARKRIAR